MQTFLPYADFRASAHVLDRQRLGKQRVETLQIMQALLGIKLDNTQKIVETGTMRFYYDADGFEVDESVAVEPGREHLYTSRVEATRKLVDTEPHEWTIKPLDKPGWVNHPATKMWRGYEWALLKYQKACVDEWLDRGYKDTCFEKTFALYFADINRRSDEKMPPWLGSKAFHLSHKSNLVRKNPEYYGPIFQVRDDLEYVWPVSDRN